MRATGITVRPPIVTVLGHVDHGKTSLLDAVRRTNFASREAGGITQSIGAWQITTSQGKKITFIDTPGHEAFSKMRSRGAKVADIIILVVAADDGVMPQTEESIKHIQLSNTPYIVAITKIDLPTAKPEAVRSQLAEYGILLEGRGGDVPSVLISAKTGKGVAELLELISLLAELNEVSSDPTAPYEAVVIETEVDKRRGPVVSVIVRNGTIHVGDNIVSSDISARVRGIFDEKQNRIPEATPGMPAQILGFSELPPVGAILTPYSGQSPTHPTSSSNLKMSLKKNKKDHSFQIILKANTAGSLEAIVGQLSQQINVVTAGIGDITQSDVNLAVSIGAPIIAFQVRAAQDVQRLADDENVGIYIYDVIYNLLEDVETWYKEEEDKYREKILGKAKILAEFPYGTSRIAGCKVLEGQIAKTSKTRLMRDSKSLGDVYIESLKKGKTEVEAVREGEEFGVVFKPSLDFRIGDVLESYRLPAKTDI